MDAMDDTKTPADIKTDLCDSAAAKAPIAFTLKEKIKWGFYASIRGKALSFMGFDVYL